MRTSAEECWRAGEPASRARLGFRPLSSTRTSKVWAAGCGLLLLLHGLVAAVSAAELGDSAPPLEIAEWIKGESIDWNQAKGKNVVVVEFWATWCGPCRVSIPHLTELQRKFEERGVVIVGVSDESATQVRPFVNDMGDKMDYRVAIDRDGKTGQAYMAAFGVSGIPHAFVLDREGRIAWHGHPMSGLEQVLDRLAANTFDLAIERKRLTGQRQVQQYLEMALRGDDDAKLEAFAKEILALEKEVGGIQFGQTLDLVAIRNTARFQTLMRDYQRALLAGRSDADLAKIEEKATPLAPKGFRFTDFKLYYQVQRNFQDYYRAATKKGTEDTAAGLAKKMEIIPPVNAEMLNEMAWTLLTDERITRRDRELALRFAQAAFDACKGRESDVVDTYARSLFDNGRVADAIAQQRRAIELCNDRDRMTDLEANLVRYQKAAGKSKK